MHKADGMQRDAGLALICMQYLYCIETVSEQNFACRIPRGFNQSEKKKYLPSSEETELWFCDVQQQELELGRGWIDSNRRR